MLYLFVAFRLACFAFFWLGVPLLLVARARFQVPWWLVVASASVLGWSFTNGAVYFQHRVAEQAYRQEQKCFEDAIRQDEAATVVLRGSGVAETEVKNPCGLGDFLLDGYEPFKGLLYGPFFLLCCSPAYWLIVVWRTSPGARRRALLLAVAVLIVEWTAIVGECIRPGYFDEMCAKADSYIWLPLSISLAAVISWLLTTQLLQRFSRRN